MAEPAVSEKEVSSPEKPISVSPSMALLESMMEDHKPKVSSKVAFKTEKPKSEEEKTPESAKSGTGGQIVEDKTPSKTGEVKKSPELPSDAKKAEQERKSSPEEKIEHGSATQIQGTKSNARGLANKASRAIAEMKANMEKSGQSPLKKDGKNKVLSVSQQIDAQMTDRDDQVFKAKMCQTIERWDEMVYWIQKVAVIKSRVTVDERNLISCAYGNAVKARRESWRKIVAIELKERTKPDSRGRNKRIRRTMYFRHTIEKQIRRLCWQILGILDKHLITHAKTAESKVFFFKMQGDFYRYLAEITFRPRERRKFTMLSMGSYKAAAKIGAMELPVTHPIRLANGLNYAVLWYDLMDNSERACRITKSTFDLSIMELDIMRGVNEELVDCAQTIMHSLRDNITLWSHAFDPDWHHDLRHAQSRFAAHAPVKGNRTQMVAVQQVEPVPKPVASTTAVKNQVSVKEIFKAKDKTGDKARRSSK